MLVRLALVAAGVGGSVLLQTPLGEANAVRRRNDFRYTPDPALMKIVAGAHRSTTADLIWLRALPDLAREFDDLELKERWLNGVFEVTTDLEPTFHTVYFYGATYLALIDKEADSAIALLERGVRLNPGHTGMLVDLGMAHWQYREDRDVAVRILRRAAERPDIDGLTLMMLSSLDVQGGRDLASLVPWLRGMEELAENPQMREANELALERTKRSIVNRALRAYAERHGSRPRALVELRGTGLIEAAAEDVVLEGLSIDAAGGVVQPRLEELKIRSAKRVGKVWCHRYQRDYGRLPTLDELREKRQVRLPRLPDGKRWILDGDELKIDPDDL